MSGTGECEAHMIIKQYPLKVFHPIYMLGWMSFGFNGFYRPASLSCVDNFSCNIFMQTFVTDLSEVHIFTFQSS